MEVENGSLEDESSLVSKKAIFHVDDCWKKSITQQTLRVGHSYNSANAGYSRKTNMSSENQWLVQMYFLLK